MLQKTRKLFKLNFIQTLPNYIGGLKLKQPFQIVYHIIFNMSSVCSKQQNSEYFKHIISTQSTVLKYKENKPDLQSVFGIAGGIASEIEISTDNV